MENATNLPEHVMKYPEGFSSDKKYPTIIFLHGAGSRHDIQKLITNPFFKITQNHSDFPFVVAAPLCTENTWFDMWERLKKFIVDIASMPFVDTTRIYLMGASMGGYATWQMAMSMPKYFAAIVPVCGGGMYWNSGRLKNIPVWAFHGAKDATVFPEESQKMVDGVNKRGGNAKLTVYPEAAHDSWTATYSNPKVFEWLLSHKKSSDCQAVNPDNYNNAKDFG